MTIDANPYRASTDSIPEPTEPRQIGAIFVICAGAIGGLSLITAFQQTCQCNHLADLEVTEYYIDNTSAFGLAMLGVCLVGASLVVR